jgi:hypothetical protein
LRFSGSPNVEAERIIRIEEEAGNCIVRLHELTKHALLGEYSTISLSPRYMLATFSMCPHRIHANIF